MDGSIWAVSRATLSGATIFIMTVRRRPKSAWLVPGNYLIVPLGSDSMNEPLLKSIYCAHQRSSYPDLLAGKYKSIHTIHRRVNFLLPMQCEIYEMSVQRAILTTSRYASNESVGAYPNRWKLEYWVYPANIVLLYQNINYFAIIEGYEKLFTSYSQTY